MSSVPRTRKAVTGLLIALGAIAAFVVLMTAELTPAEKGVDEVTAAESPSTAEADPLTAEAIAEPEQKLSRSASREGPREARLQRTPAVLAPESVEIDVLSLDTPEPKRERHAPVPSSIAPAVLTGQVRLPPRSREPFEVLFVAGLNSGKSLKMSDAVNYRIEDLLPGVGIVQLTQGKKKILRFVKLTSRLTTKLDFDLVRTRSGSGVLTDLLTSLPASTGFVEIDGERVPASVKGDFTAPDIAEGDAIFYASGNGFEFRRAVVKWTSFRRGPAKPFDFQLRRSTPITVSFEGIFDPEDTAIAVIVPKSQGSFSVAFEKCCIVAGRKGARDVVVEGVPCEEGVRVYLFCNSAITERRFFELDGLDPTATFGRAVRFTLESRKRLRGTVLLDGVPVSGARVKIESAEIAVATERHFGAETFSRFAFPVLPCARKEMETGKDGKFSFEIADLHMPATLSIDKPGIPAFREAVPTGSFDLGAIELRTLTDEAAAAAALVFEFAEERPRVLQIRHSGPGDVNGKKLEWNLTGLRTPPFPVAPGNYRIRFGGEGSAKALDVKVDGETVVSVGRGAGEAR